MAVTVANAARVAPIGDADVPRVAEFLHANLNSRLTAEQWARAVVVPWTVDRPNAGFLLADGDTIVGVQLAFYSERTIDDRRERFCNLGAWCVLPAYRLHSLRLLKAVLAQEGYHFTDLSPSGNVPAVNSKLSFRFLDSATALVPNFPWPAWPGRCVISSDPQLIERTLTGRELELYRDHSTTGAARHLVLVRDDEWCYVVFRKERWRRLRLFATVLYVSNPDLFRRMARALGNHLLTRHGVVGTLAEDQIVRQRPRPSFRVQAPRKRMYLSPRLGPTQIDYLYSELVCVPW